jgi:hypothetical protein
LFSIQYNSLSPPALGEGSHSRLARRKRSRVQVPTNRAEALRDDAFQVRVRSIDQRIDDRDGDIGAPDHAVNVGELEGGSLAIGKPFRLRPWIWRLVPGRDVEMESGRAQLHALCDGRCSRRRLRSHSSGEHGIGALGNRRRRRLHLFERASRI